MIIRVGVSRKEQIRDGVYGNGCVGRSGGDTLLIFLTSTKKLFFKFL